MELIKGSFAEAKVFTEDIEDYARAQLQMICDHPVAEGSKIRVMPDVHPGKVGTIGLTMTVGKRIMPNLLGIVSPYPLTWLEGELMERYIADVKTVQTFAALNREIMLAEILKGMKWKEVEGSGTVFFCP